MDIVSIPQRARDLQRVAIDSLCACKSRRVLFSPPAPRVNLASDAGQLVTQVYLARRPDTQLCTRFVPLVRDGDAWLKIHGESENESTLPSGTLQTYCKRGWCRLEVSKRIKTLILWRNMHALI